MTTIKIPTRSELGKIFPIEGVTPRHLRTREEFELDPGADAELWSNGQIFALIPNKWGIMMWTMIDPSTVVFKGDKTMNVEVKAEISFHDGRFSVKEKRTGFMWKTWLVAKDGDKTAMAILTHKIWEEALGQESMPSGFIEMIGDEGMAAAKEAAESASKGMLEAFEKVYSKAVQELGQSPDFASMGLENEPAWKTPVRVIREILEN